MFSCMIMKSPGKKTTSTQEFSHHLEEFISIEIIQHLRETTCGSDRFPNIHWPIACECAKATNLELQDATMNMNTDVECTKATNLELKVMLALLNASDEWQ